MSDYISNSNQQRILEDIADEEDLSLLRRDHVNEESQQQDETPSFCELVSQKQFDRFQYTHPKDTDVHKYSAAENFIVNDESLSVVFAMAIGHANFLSLTDQAPFTETKSKNHTQIFKPPNAILAKEVMRRAHFLFNCTYEKPDDNPLFNKVSKQLRMPKPTGWSRKELLTFLQEKTIKLQDMDVAFIHSQIFLYKLFLEREMKSQNLKPDSTSWDRGGWEGIVANVRLIEIVLCDDFRQDFIHRNDAVSRQQLDARGTESQTITFWEKVRRRFNDRSYKVTSCPLDANWGRDIFLDIRDCNWEQLDAFGLTSIPDENACKLHYMSLNNKLGQVYKNWKASGNGDNQVAGSLEEAQYGTVNLELLPMQGGDRIDFLGNCNICVMYLWFALIKAGSFLYSQTEFPSAFQADDENAPKIKLTRAESASIGSTSATSSKSSSTRNKKIPAVNVRSEIEQFSQKIDRLNDSMLLDSQYDRFIAEKRYLISDLKDLKKEIDDLFEKKHIAELDNESEQVKNRKAIKKISRDRWSQRYDETEKILLEKQQEIDEVDRKCKIIESRLFAIREKTPKRSGNSLKQAGRRVVPSSVIVSDLTAEDDCVGGIINFDTPAAATTPTATNSDLNRMSQKQNNKRKRSDEGKNDTPPESVDLLAQKTPDEEYDDDDDDDDDELFQKVLN
jgi:hypothetical protein